MINDSLAKAVCQLLEDQKLFCPPILQKGLFTVGALDNIDHNPSATTANIQVLGHDLSV